MKNITKSLILLLGIFTISCNNDDIEDRPVITPTDSPVLSAPEEGNAYVLAFENASEQVERFVWSAASFDLDVAITYTVELDLAGNEFANAQSLGSVTGQYQLPVTVESLNGAAIAAGGTPFEAGQYEVRVRASVNDTFESLFSNVVSITITPYVSYPFEDLFLVGSATAAGWDNLASNNNMYALSRDPENENIYYYTGLFNAGEFKLVRTRGQWAPQYGANGSALAFRPTEADPDPSNIQVATAGYYTLTVNVDELTYTMESYDASAAPTYPTIGIIGTATPGGWDADTDMIQSTFDPHMWYLRNQVLTVGGELKFRANDAWDVNWGSGTSYSGQATTGGPNIPIGITSTGTYDIWFNDLTGRYIYIPVN